MGKFLTRWFWRIALLLFFTVLVYQGWIFSQVVYWNHYNPSSSAFMRDRLETLRQKDAAAEVRMQWVPYERISAHLKRAVVAAEDGKFMKHEGLDFDAIQYAHEKNVKRGRLVAGGSTITQQLAKNLFLSGEKTPWRKIQEALIALMLEKVMSKRRILEIYLNVIEWGHGVFGAEAAARHYYGIPAASITAEQAARLAAMIPNPRLYDQRRHTSTSWLSRKSGLIRGRMASAHIP